MEAFGRLKLDDLLLGEASGPVRGWSLSNAMRVVQSVGLQLRVA